MTTAASLERRLTADAAWNFAALGMTAGVGAAATFLIAGRMGAGALGVFAQLYAAHVIAAQIAVLGLHDSAQKHVAECHGRGEPDGGAVGAALGLTVVPALAVAALLAAAAAWIGALVSSADVRQGLYLVAAGIVPFALNKVLFGVLNGRGQLRDYALMQCVRALLVLVAALWITGPGMPVYAVGGIFAAAELALLPCLLLVVRPTVTGGAGLKACATGYPVGPAWWRRHLSFGGRGVLNGVLLEAHLRIDVLVLSYFVTDRSVGVYAFAMLFAEGLYQVPVVIRTVAFPRLVQFACRGDRDGLSRTSRRLSLASGGAAVACAAIIALIFPPLAGAFDPAFVRDGLPVLLILLGGVTLYAFVVPFDQLLLQSGLPGRQSLLMATYVGANVLLNLLLIPRFGLTGAAAATALALAFAAGLVLLTSWCWLGYRGGVLLHRTRAA